MYGAIIGDIAGSIFEYSQIKNVSNIECKEIIPENGFYSDDTILTVAIADAIMHGKNYEKYLKLYGKKYENYKPEYKPYFKASFSPGFIKWVNSDFEGTSIGNGAMMRISPIGEAFKTKNEVLKNVMAATQPSHNSKEAIYCAGIVALIGFYAKKGLNKTQIINELNLNIKEPKIEKFNSTCHETLDVCLYSTFTSSTFEESIKKAISYGGDTDTNACIVGGMAEQLYGLDSNLKKEVRNKIPEEFINIIDSFERFIDNEYER